jgi:hypothetical protein
VKGAWHTVASFAFPPKLGSTSFLATKHPMDVSSLAGWVMSQPVSIPLQDGLGLFHHLAPYLPQLALRLACPEPAEAACPKGRRHEVTTFHVFDHRYLRSTLSAGGSSARVGRSATHPSHPLTILVQALQLLWLVNIHDSYKCSLPLTIASYPNPLPGWSFQERFGLTASTPPAQADFGALSERLHTHQGCTLSACFHRIAATGHWVQTKALYLR